MLKLMQSSCSVVLLRDSFHVSRISVCSLPDFEQVISQRYLACSPKLLAVTAKPFYLSILDDLMGRKCKNKKNKKKIISSASKKTKNASLSLVKHFLSANKFIIPKMSCSNASCSEMTQKFDKSLSTADSDSNDDVIILDTPDNDDVQVLYDSRHPRNDQLQYYLKNKEELTSWKNLSAAEIKEAAKKGKEKYQEIRQERFTNYGEEITKGGNSANPEREGFVFRVLSWNILSQKLMEQHNHLYSNSHNASLDWEYRMSLILSEIKDSNADILTLQEVEERSFHNRPELKELGYEGIFKKRTNDKLDGCGVYYRSDNLTLKEFSFVEFYQPGVRLLDRDNIGIVARFEPKGFEGTEFIVATTHLLYNPRRHDIKLVQMQLLLAEIERLAFNGALQQEDKFIPLYHPCILTGDLNLSPQTGVYNLITQGELQYDQLSSRNLSNLDSPNSYNCLSKALLPSHLGITDSCQHDKVVSNRQLVRQSLEEERRLIQLYNSEKILDRFLRSDEPNWRDEDPRKSNKTDLQNKYGTGVLSHNMKFKSVYTHEKDGKPEATTHQQWWMTVDYIFYSPVSKKDKESNLQLISYKGLPSTEEAEDHIKALPNLFCGSDHLPLISSFFLAKS